MSEARSSTNLSEFFSDDTEGLRLVDFLKQRREVARKQKFLFMDCQTDRMSFDVQLEKLPTPQLKGENEKASDAEAPSNSPAIEENIVSQAMASGSANAFQHADVTNTNRIRSNRSTIRKSVGVMSPSDKLRRFSIKNYSAKKAVGGRRTLLQEFESTVEERNFNPVQFSTPIVQRTQAVPQSSPITSNLTQPEDVEQRNAESPNAYRSCCNHTDTVMKSLLRKDAELKQCMESFLDKTIKQIESKSQTVQRNSAANLTVNRMSDSAPLKRTFTVETGSVPGQFVLRSDRSNTHNNSKESPKQNDLTSQRSRQNSKILNSHSKNRSQQEESQKTRNENVELPNSSQNRLSVITPTRNIEIPETQVQAIVINNSIPNGSVTEQQVIVIPINQATRKKSGGKDDINTSTAVQNIQEEEDNLRLDLILTDDEDNTPKSTSQSVQHTTEIPMNLAPAGSYSLRKKRLRKRTSSKQKLCNDNSQQHTSGKEMNLAPPAGRNKHILRKNYKPLNSPPGTPLNGEKYAQELARMSNYEILDLRKRNSMGQIFVISGRRSRRSLEEVTKKKHQLDEKIENELLKRNKQNISQHPTCQVDSENAEHGGLHTPCNLDFIDETESDRVKFKNNKTKERHSKEKEVPEVLKQYLEISERCSKRKDRTLSKNTTTRLTLYTQDLMESTHSDSLTKKSKSTKSRYSSRSRSKKLNAPSLQSPTPAITSESKMQNTTITTNRTAVATTTTTDEIQNNPETVDGNVIVNSTTTEETQTDRNNRHCNVKENLTILPPPPGFESYAENSQNRNANQYSTNVTLALNDDNLFKKPLNRPPKSRGRKKAVKLAQESVDANQGSIDGSESGDLTAGGSLRRSKRGRVPLIIPPIVAEFQQREIRRLERLNQQKKQQMKKRKQSGKEQNMNKLNKAKTKKTKSTNNSAHEKQKENTSSMRTNNYSHIEFDPPPIEYLNNVFDQLKQNSLIENTVVNPVLPQQPTLKPVKVRLRRLSPPETITATGSTSVSSTTACNTSCSSTNSNIDYISWLKTLGNQHTSDAFKDTRVASSGNLHFTELQGLEYAFYDTVENSSLGYLRFKPRQCKPRKKAKHFNLNFVVLLGLFRITINQEENDLSVGDVLVIEKQSYYTIENLSDDIGILMVIKK